MRLLLDTVAFLWLAEDDARLPAVAREAIVDPANDVFLSAASAWEIAITHRTLEARRLHYSLPPEPPRGRDPAVG